MSELFGSDFITQKYLKRYPDSERVRIWRSKLVYIQTENGVWRIDAKGYTYAGRGDAWILPFDEAVRQVSHCGPEKQARFLDVRPFSAKRFMREMLSSIVSKIPLPDDAPEHVGEIWECEREQIAADILGGRS